MMLLCYVIKKKSIKSGRYYFAVAVRQDQLHVRETLDNEISSFRVQESNFKKAR